MPVNTSALYEPMIQRDVDAIEPALRAENATPFELAEAVMRFAVLAFCPSEHSKAALIAASYLPDLIGIVSDPIPLIKECAIYTAESRAPWSEPPILEAPAGDLPSEAGSEEIAEAVRERDRLRGERWLARLLQDEDALPRFRAAASQFAAADAMSLPLAMAAQRIATMFPPLYTFAALRVAVDAWTNAGWSAAEPSAVDVSAEALGRLTETFEAEEGSPLVFQEIACFFANFEIARDGQSGAAERTLHGSIGTPSYRLARDYAAYLQCVALRLRNDRSEINDFLNRIVRAAWKNLARGESFDAWSHA